MARSDIIRAGGNPSAYSKDEVGGKGLYILKLHQVAQETGMFNVPNFFIVPTQAQRGGLNNDLGTQVVYTSYEVEKGFKELKKPVGVRSSSPLEDGLKASFAGMFESVYNNHNYEDAMRAAHFVYQSAFKDRVKQYAEKMDMPTPNEMALIFQEQVTGHLEEGIIQLEEDKAVVECIDKQDRIFDHEIDYDFLDEGYAFKSYLDMYGSFESNLDKRDYITEADSHYAIQCAREAKKALGLEGLVQVEFLLAPAKPPYFVQIRQLPKAPSHSDQLNLDIPKGVPYIESEICNDVPGDLTLPTYVTTSQGSFKQILMETGQAGSLGLGHKNDERADRFNKESNLSSNKDFDTFKRIIEAFGPLMGLEGRDICRQSWKRGNSLFKDYILICDKLDESVMAMADVTTNKRAIITCDEAMKTSHAMTIARDLGIMCMGIKGNLYELEPKFFHQVETGDMIRMKSNGKKAVVYLEKKRTSDPYDDL